MRIRTPWHTREAGGGDLAHFPVLFYDILFERYPSTKPLFFRNTPGAQRKMMGQTLMAVVDHWDDPSAVAGVLEPMGHDHVGYGVTVEMYGWVGECLIEAIARVCEDRWSEAHADAWRRAYGVIAEHMQRGAR